MFKWLFGKRANGDGASTGGTEPGANTGAEQVAPVIAEAAVQAPPAHAVAPSPAVLTASVATVEDTVAPTAVALTRFRAALSDAEDEPPRVGAAAIIVTPSKQQEAKVVRVQAGGRRVIASLANAQAARVYLRRADGTYRPEGAPSQIASRLVIGGTV